MALVLPTYPDTRYEPDPLIHLTSRSERERLNTSALKAFLHLVDRWGIRDEDARFFWAGYRTALIYLEEAARALAGCRYPDPDLLSDWHF